MSYISNLLLAFELATNAFAVSISGGATISPFRISDTLKFAVFFGGLFLGRKMGHFFEHEARLVGGMILIGLGISLLFLNS